MKNNLLIYNRQFFQLSETFIYHYVVGAAYKYRIHLLSYEMENKDIFPLPDFAEEYRLRSYNNWYDRIKSLMQRVFRKNKSIFSDYYYRYIISIIMNAPIHLIHAHYGDYAYTILPIARECNVPLIVNFHGYDASRSTLSSKYMQNIKEMFEYVDAIIIVSPHMIDTLQLAPYLKKVHLIPYGIDADYFKPNASITKNTIDILHSGRIVDKKGVPDLIKVFHRLHNKYHNLKLHIIGNGAQLEECKNIALDLGIPENCIKFYGAQSHVSVKAHMDIADIFVLNSRTSKNGNMEGLPNSILEAMSMEKAVVSTEHAGIPYAIKNGENGLLVPERDNEALEVAIERLYLDRQLRMRLGKAARQSILEDFTVQKMQAKINSVYQSILTKQTIH
jgi:colanic acid/amylovoran biosynthesis glycosyltransferase